MRVVPEFSYRDALGGDSLAEMGLQVLLHSNICRTKKSSVAHMKA